MALIHRRVSFLRGMPKTLLRYEGQPAGQSLVVFTLMVGLIMVLLLGMLDLGRTYFTFLAMQDAAGEGVAFAAVHPTWRTSGDKTDPNNTTYRVRNSAPTGTLVDWSTATVTVNDPCAIPKVLQITVTVSAPYRLLTPFVSDLVSGATLTLTARSVAIMTSSCP